MARIMRLNKMHENAASGGFRSAWRGFSGWDRVAFVVLAASLVLLLFLRSRTPGSSLIVAGFLFFVSVVYLFFSQCVPWLRTHWLWSLRNRLILAYLFIAVVPLLLLGSMAALCTYAFYRHFGAYLVYADFDKRIDQVGNTAQALANVYAVQAAANHGIIDTQSLPPRAELFIEEQQANLPGLKIEVGSGEEFLQRAPGPRHNRFEGLVQTGDTVALRAVVVRRIPEGRVLVSVSVPLTPEFAATIEPDLGPVQIDVMHSAPGASRLQFPPIPGFVPLRQIEAPDRPVPRASHWFDYRITGFERINAVNAAAIGNPSADLPVVAIFTTRASILNDRLFTLVGEWGGIAVTALPIIGGFFVLIEFAALAAGVGLTHSITRSVDNLYRATEYVRAGNLDYRVRISRRDQLGALTESFNSMTASIGTLLHEQKQRQQLENELAIASEVQAQLFPRERPRVADVDIEGVCKPARIVSGDYYDFLDLGPGRLGIALADVSGKGVSAALIMASLQAALRGLSVADGRTMGTGEIVRRLNEHLFRGTSSERYATLFFGIFDATSHRFQYTNAGHPPPFFLHKQQFTRLGCGGTVLGLFENCEYEQAIIEVQAGDLLVAYSDGLTDAEGPGAEEFGDQRLADLITSNRDGSAHAVVKVIVAAVEKWIGKSEQEDDVTVVAARFGS